MSELKEVIVYTTPNCMQCEMTKKELTKRSIEFDTIDVSTDKEAHEFLTSKGVRSMPCVTYKDDLWTGFRPDKLNAIQ